MIKIVLDANIFVSAIINNHGKPAQILQLVREDKLELIVSPEIIAELKRVLLYPKIKKYHHSSPQEIDKRIKDIAKFTDPITVKIKIDAIADDPSDNIYLECAIQGKADYIISGDHHLKNLKIFQGTKIVDADTFLKLLSIKND